MEKQYVLSEQEHRTLCNKLETIGVDVAFINRKLSPEQKEELKPVLISIDDKVNLLMKSLGWR